MKSLVLAALALASSAHAQSTPAPLSGEKHDAFEAYLSCLHARAHDLDDGRSDATSLAKVIAQDCREVMSTAVDIFTRGEPQASRDALYLEWLSKEVWQSTAVVALERENRQAAHAAGAPPAMAPSATQASAEAAHKPVPSPKDATTRAAPKKRVTAKAAPKAGPLFGPDGKPMSAWRRAYIAKHGHQPPKRP